MVLYYNFNRLAYTSDRLKAKIWCIFVTSDVTPIFQAQTSPQDSGSVVVKVHYTCTIALRVPLETPFRDLQEKIAQKLGQPVTNIRLR